MDNKNLSENQQLIIGGTYKHFKGNLYTVIGLANDSNNPENKLVVYRALYGNNQLWVRPFDEFMSKVDKEKYPYSVQEYRFELVENNKK